MVIGKSTPVVRYIYNGQTLKNGRILDLPTAKAEIDGVQVINVLAKDGVNFSRFKATFYCRNDDGWRELSSNSKIPYSYHLDTQRVKPIEIKLYDKSNLVGQIIRDAQETAVERVHKEEGYFGIGIYRNKTEANHGTLWRSAFQMGASFTFTIGARYNKSASRSTDTTKCWSKIPCFQYQNFDAFASTAPYSCPWIAVEFNENSIPLTHFKHPKRAIYILGSEDKGLPRALKQACAHVISIPSVPSRGQSLNVAVSGSIVMYDRLVKQMQMDPTVPKTLENTVPKTLENIGAQTCLSNSKNNINHIDSEIPSPSQKNELLTTKEDSEKSSKKRKV
eukprot:GSMAST32.ASY1.ANO1.239.1 assembled CDS